MHIGEGRRGDRIARNRTGYFVLHIYIFLFFFFLTFILKCIKFSWKITEEFVFSAARKNVNGYQFRKH